MKYTAVYEREPDGRWVVEIPEVEGCHSYGRTIEQARERVREALSLFVENADAAEIADDIRLPKRVQHDIVAAQELRQQLEKTRFRLAQVEQRAVRRLRRELHLGHRDAGAILGLSFQRVHQLEKKKAG
ncbi:MAG: type II toxin-antitoxin system HicB family antitoxin [Vicinamibacterales bacterium]